jgi:hypothetical protein
MVLWEWEMHEHQLDVVSVFGADLADALIRCLTSRAFEIGEFDNSYWRLFGAHLNSDSLHL